MSASRDLRLVWIDLEMTGLNPATRRHSGDRRGGDRPRPRAAGGGRAGGRRARGVPRADERPGAPHAHARTACWRRFRDGGVSLREAERAVLTAIAPHCPAGEGLLAGNSVFHDWRFLARHMPRLEQHLHFRQVDIGTFSALVNAWYPQHQLPARARQPPGDGRRARQPGRAALLLRARLQGRPEPTERLMSTRTSRVRA